MNDGHIIETAETVGGIARPDPTPGHSFWDRLVAIAVLGGGVLVTFLWVAILVYALIIFLF